MPEKLKSHWSAQSEFQTAVSYTKIHNSKIVEATRLKFYEHAHKAISNNFNIHFIAQIMPQRGSNSHYILLHPERSIH
jgi:hypothetical protein